MEKGYDRNNITRDNYRASFRPGGWLGVIDAIESLKALEQPQSQASPQSSKKAKTLEHAPLSLEEVEQKNASKGIVELIRAINEERRTQGADLIKGAELRKQCLRFLFTTFSEATAVHYLELCKQFLEAYNVYIDSENPAAVVLSNISRSPLTKQVGEGYYYIDPKRLEQLEEELEACMEEIKKISPIIHTDEGGEAFQNYSRKRDKLKSQIAESRFILGLNN